MGNSDVLDVISLNEAMNGIDTVIHSAALVSFDKRKESRCIIQMLMALPML
jgi:hypothetical protein